MKKIIFCNIPMKSLENNQLDYSGTGNINCKCTEKLNFGLIAVLSEKIKPDDDVLVILNKTPIPKNDHSDENIQIFKTEFEKMCGIPLKDDKNCKIITSSFTETQEDMQTMFRNYAGYLQENAWIYADTTFGPRLNLPIMMSVLNFAERFFDARIKLILNIKVNFDKDNKPVPGTQALYDISPFYKLSAMTAAMKANDGKQALKFLDEFFKL